MRALLLATPVVAVVFMSNSVIAQSDERAGAASVVRAEAPIVQVQPGAAGAPTVHVHREPPERRPFTFNREQKISIHILKRAKRSRRGCRRSTRNNRSWTRRWTRS